MAPALSIHEPRVLAADTIVGDKVVSTKNEDLGTIRHLMIDLEKGRIAYAVLSFGGFLGMGDKLFAIPWSAFGLDAPAHTFILNIDQEKLQNAPGFDQDNWPNMADQAWGNSVADYYGTASYLG